MGMDVYGKAPKNAKGEYFRNNVWWWRPLWNYCQEVSAIARTVKHGHSNDGDGLNDLGAQELAADLRGQIALGKTAQYAKEYQAELDAIPDEKCDLCGGTGKRTDMEVANGCNGCHGKGTREPFAKSYPFSVENVEEFATFLENCGGFEIC